MERGPESSSSQDPENGESVCARRQPSPLRWPLNPRIGSWVIGGAGSRGSLGEWGGGLKSGGRTRRFGVTLAGPLPFPHLAEDTPPGLGSPPSSPPRTSPGAVLGPAPSLRVPPFPDLVPPSLPAPDTSSPRLPPDAAKFLRSGPRAEPGPGRSGVPAALSPRAEPGPAPTPPSHAVRPLEELPPPARGALGAGPGRDVRRPRAPGRRQQEARAAGAEEDGSVTDGGGSGRAGTARGGRLGRRGCAGELSWASQAARVGRLGVAPVVIRRSPAGRGAPVDFASHQEAPAGRAGVGVGARGADWGPGGPGEIEWERHAGGVPHPAPQNPVPSRVHGRPRASWILGRR